MKPSLSSFALLIACWLPLAAQDSGLPAPQPRRGLTLMGALENTLRRHPMLRVSEEDVALSRAALLRARSQFDPVLQSDLGQSRSYRPLGQIERAILDGPGSATTNSTTLGLNATRMYRNGISMGPVLQVSRTTDSLFAPYGLNQSRLAFEVNLPLLRGRGRDVVMAQETAAGLQVDAALFDLNQNISDLLVNSAQAYWNTVAAAKSLSVFAGAEQRGHTYVSTVEALIEADKIPRSEISQVRANLADRTASRVAAQQRMVEARQQLAVAIGYPLEEMADAPDAMDPMPSPETGAAELDAALVNAFIAKALGNRADLLALRKRNESADTLLVAARNQLRPQVDLRLGTGYSGLREGTRFDQYLASPFSGIRGADLIAGLRYSFPLGNHAAKARFAEVNAVSRQARYRVDDAARTVASQVVVALEGVRNAAAQWEKARESVSHFQTALDNEREKYRLGFGSLVDVLTVEDRLTGVLAAEVEAELGYALALTRLRLASGTVVAPDRSVHSVEASIFRTLPQPDNGEIQ
jgi:outer membrane protein